MWHHNQCICKACLHCALSEHASPEYRSLENPFHTEGTSKKPLDNGELEGGVEATEEGGEVDGSKGCGEIGDGDLLLDLILKKEQSLDLWLAVLMVGSTG